MDRLPILRLLLSPSLLSGSLVLVAACGVCAMGAWSYVSANALFYDFLFGPGGVQAALLNAPDKLWLLRHILSSSPAYYTFVIAASIVTSMSVYAMLQAAAGLHEDLALLQKGRPYSRSFRQELFSRLWVRLLGGIAWVCYTLFFINLITPFVLLLIRTGVDMFEAKAVTGGLAMGAGAMALLAICLHIHVVFLRLFLLRYRAFGGADVLIAEKMRS